MSATSMLPATCAATGFRLIAQGGRPLPPCAKETRNDEILRFVEYWKQRSRLGNRRLQLVFG